LATWCRAVGARVTALTTAAVGPNPETLTVAGVFGVSSNARNTAATFAGLAAVDELVGALEVGEAWSASDCEAGADDVPMRCVAPGIEA
jgi:hypothetical protein